MTTGRSPARSSGRNRRWAWAIAVLLLCLSTAAWIVITIRHRQRDAWIQSVRRLPVQVLLGAYWPPDDQKFLFPIYQQLGRKNVRVILETESDVEKFLDAPTPFPADVVVLYDISLGSVAADKLAARFPGIDIREME